MHRVVLPALAALALAGCSEVATAPMADPAGPRLSHERTYFQINAAGCGPASGVIRCSYEIENTDDLVLDVFIGLHLEVTYECIHPKKGTVQISGTAVLPSVQWEQVATGATGAVVSETTLLLAPQGGNSYTGNMNRLNLCKGGQTYRIVSYDRVEYWELYVENANNRNQWACLGSDNRLGCHSS